MSEHKLPVSKTRDCYKLAQLQPVLLVQIIPCAYHVITRACVSVRSGAQRWCGNYWLQFSRMVPGRPWLYIRRVEFSSSSCRVFFIYRVFFFLLPLLSSFSFFSSSSLCVWILTTWVKLIPWKQISDYTKLNECLPSCLSKGREETALIWLLISHS